MWLRVRIAPSAGTVTSRQNLKILSKIKAKREEEEEKEDEE